MFGLEALVLVALALAFAFSIGAHYTGACMGLPYAAHAIRARTALWVMAPLSLVGAVAASETVEGTVGHGLVAASSVDLGLAVEIVAVAFALVSLYNYVRVPTSTIQILVFAVVGVALGHGLAVEWGTIAGLVVLWAVAPLVCLAGGFLAIRLVDRIRGPVAAGTLGGGSSLVPGAAYALVGVGAAASFVMGANDVSNATGGFVMTGLFDPVLAATVGGVGLALGVLFWGRPLLERVAFDIVELDPRMAASAQFVQASVVLGATTVGLFTSLNQALVGAMVGVGLARRRATVHWSTVRGILTGWALGPVSGLALGGLVAVGLGRFGVT